MFVKTHLLKMSLYKIYPESKHQLLRQTEHRISLSFEMFLFISSGLIQIRQRTMHLHKTYKLLSAGENYYNQEIALITKKFGRNEFRITSIYGDYQMEEFDTKSESFAVRKQDQVVAHITRVSLDSTSNYQVDIVLDEDQIFILALVIVIDQIIDDQRANEEAVEVTKFMNDLSRVSSLR